MRWKPYSIIGLIPPGLIVKHILVFFICHFLIFIRAASQDILGPSGSGEFGHTITILSNGNFVITDPSFDDGSIKDAGAVYLYNGATNELISSLKGSSPGDRVGAGGVVVMTNGNFVVGSPYWNNGTAIHAGAATWINASTGLNGVVSQSNSLVGSSSDDEVSVLIVALTNGNYVVASIFWNNGNIQRVGAVTWGNGVTGTTGVVSAQNSLIGLKANDEVGHPHPLQNGNYVVGSYVWDNGSIVNAGAATFCKGDAPTTGNVTPQNSLVGITRNDQVGDYIKTFVNGNYLVLSSTWGNSSAAPFAGAVTWCNGTIGLTGPVSINNSLVGRSTGDFVGHGVYILPNDNYVVVSPTYRHTAVNAGAITWGSGTTGIAGYPNETNSLVGLHANDNLGSSGVTVLNNSNYLISSPFWKGTSGSFSPGAGAVTFGNGATGISGSVSASNSLIGTLATDQVGMLGVAVLSNDNYVVSSPYWTRGNISQAGAVTYGNGVSGTTGIVSAANSWVGTAAFNRVGLGRVHPLTNGNFVITSFEWDNGPLANVGAATWVNGSAVSTGEVTASNSLVGAAAGDKIGIGGTTTLTNGNYLVISSEWSNGSIPNAGAITWGNGATGTTGVVSVNNSLVGSTAEDRLYYVIALFNGNYIVRSPQWDNGATVDAGAVTWGNGLSGTTGPVSSTNSLVGSSAQDAIGLSHQNVSVKSGFITSSYRWDDGAVQDAGAVTLISGSSALTGTVTSCNSILGTGIGSFAYDTIYGRLFAAKASGDLVVIFSFKARELAISKDSTTVLISDTNTVYMITPDGCRLIASIKREGSEPVTGLVNAKVTIDANVQTIPGGQPYVTRHFDIGPVSNTASSTGSLSLFFTQAELNTYNLSRGIYLPLPVGPNDATGKANVRIIQYHGDGTAPGNYTGEKEIIDPADADIRWDSVNIRWEINFSVDGFSGFYLASALPPFKLISFDGQLQQVNNALLSWQVAPVIPGMAYSLEKSLNGVDFMIVNFQTGNSTQANFSYDDNHLSNGTYHYRLKITDLAGIILYSDTVVLDVNAGTTVVRGVYPNPVVRGDKLTVNLPGMTGPAIQIFNSLGQVVYSQRFFTGTPIQIPMPPVWASGIYFLRVRSADLNFEQKVLIR
jgi:hypothetical protein